MPLQVPEDLPGLDTRTDARLQTKDFAGSQRASCDERALWYAAAGVGMTVCLRAVHRVASVNDGT